MGVGQPPCWYQAPCFIEHGRADTRPFARSRFALHHCTTESYSVPCPYVSSRFCAVVFPSLHSAGADDTRHSLLSWFYKRHWSITAVRAAARLTLARLASAVGRSTTAAAHRRAAAEGSVAQPRCAACEPFWGQSPHVGPRCFWSFGLEVDVSP